MNALLQGYPVVHCLTVGVIEADAPLLHDRAVLATLERLHKVLTGVEHRDVLQPQPLEGLSALELEALQVVVLAAVVRSLEEVWVADVRGWLRAPSDHVLYHLQVQLVVDAELVINEKALMGLKLL